MFKPTADSILVSLKADTCPGIDATAVSAIKDASAAYRQVQTDQTAAQSGATTGRTGLETTMAAIARQRREIHTPRTPAGPPARRPPP